jgi:hypothetical protein
MKKGKHEEEMTDSEQKQLEEIEAKSRQVFDPEEGIYDDRKRRVTDLKECSRVTLPKPLPPAEEALIEMRRNSQKTLYDRFREEHTNKNGEQKSNLTTEEQKSA